MLSVLLLIAAAIAYIYLHKSTPWYYDDEDSEVPAHKARLIESSDWLFAQPSSDVETARSPTGIDFWNVPGPSVDVSTARTATSFKFLKPALPQQRVGNVITARSAHSIVDVATARIKSFGQLTNVCTARSSSTVNCVNSKSQPAKHSANGNVVAAGCDEDLLTCVDGDVHIATENLVTAKLNEVDMNFEQKYRRNVEQFVVLMPADPAVPVPADPATKAAMKAIKRMKRKNKAEPSRASLESNASTAVGVDLSVTSSTEKVVVGIIEEVVNDELRCFNVRAKI